MPKEGVSLLRHEDILRYEEILEVVEIAVHLGIVKVRVTGGEPLVRRGALDFMKSLVRISGLQEVTLTTNGVLLEKSAEQIFLAGIKRINVSLDSLNAHKYAYITGGGDLNQVLKGIETARFTGLEPIKINVVAIKGFNDDEILDFVNLAIEKPYQVRFIELMDLCGAALHPESGYLSNLEIMEKVKEVHTLVAVAKIQGTDGPANIFRIGEAAGEIGFIRSGNIHLCKFCNRLRLTADGHLKACLLTDEETDLRSLLRSGQGYACLKEAIEKAIWRKPLSRHGFGQNAQIKKCARAMSSIGG